MNSKKPNLKCNGCGWKFYEFDLVEKIDEDGYAINVCPECGCESWSEINEENEENEEIISWWTISIKLMDGTVKRFKCPSINFGRIAKSKFKAIESYKEVKSVDIIEASALFDYIEEVKACDLI